MDQTRDHIQMDHRRKVVQSPAIRPSPGSTGNHSNRLRYPWCLCSKPESDSEHISIHSRSQNRCCNHPRIFPEVWADTSPNSSAHLRRSSYSWNLSFCPRNQMGCDYEYISIHSCNRSQSYNCPHTHPERRLVSIPNASDWFVDLREKRNNVSTGIHYE